MAAAGGKMGGRAVSARTIRWRLSAASLAILFLALPGNADPATYRQQVEARRKAEAKAERIARRHDPYRRIRPYQTLDEVYSDLDAIIADHPNLIAAGTIGQSVDGRPLRWFKLTAGEGDKAQVLITANIHGHELAGGQMAKALLRYLADNYGKDRQVTWLLDSAELHFIPIMNPDAMVRTVDMQLGWGITTFIRKNMDEVDLNRNFPYPGHEESGNKESEVYGGPEPISEPETRALIAFISDHHFILALNFHTAGGWILFPPANSPEPTLDTELMRRIAQDYRARQFEKYTLCPEIELYPIQGGLDDYLYHHFGILSFTVELARNMGQRGRIPHGGTISPIFWAFNTYHLDREIANNIPGALTMIEAAIKIHAQPELRQWQPPADKWVGEPE